MMNKGNISNEELLELYKEGNFSGFDNFYQRNHKMIFAYFIKKCGSITLAEDYLQETFFRVHKYIHTYHSNKSALTWIFTIANNVLTSETNKLKKVMSRSPTQDHSKINDIQRLELQNEINQYLQYFSPKDQDILIERLLKEESYYKIAKNHQLKEANVRQKVSRMIKHLRAVTSKP